jgi:hypothetical protein
VAAVQDVEAAVGEDDAPLPRAPKRGAGARRPGSSRASRPADLGRPPRSGRGTVTARSPGNGLRRLRADRARGSRAPPLASSRSASRRRPAGVRCRSVSGPGAAARRRGRRPAPRCGPPPCRVARAPTGTWQPPSTAEEGALRTDAGSGRASWSTAEPPMDLGRHLRSRRWRARPAPRPGASSGGSSTRRCARAIRGGARRRRRAGSPRRLGLVQLGEAGVEVAAQVRTSRSGRSARSCARRRASPCRRGRRPAESSEPRHRPGAAEQDVARILAGTDRGEDEPVRQPGRHVLERVDGEIGPPARSAVVDLLGEEAAVPDAGQRHVEDAVAGGADDLDLDLELRHLGSAQGVADRMRLPERELAAARCDPHGRGQPDHHCDCAPSMTRRTSSRIARALAVHECSRAPAAKVPTTDWLWRAPERPVLPHVVDLGLERDAHLAAGPPASAGPGRPAGRTLGVASL